MKKSALVIYLLVFVVGLGLGFSIAMRRVFLTRADYVRLLHTDCQHRAGAYLHFLQAQDSGRPDEMTGLRLRALTNLSAYVQEVQSLQAEGVTWAPLDRSLYSNAASYLASHPLPR